MSLVQCSAYPHFEDSMTTSRDLVGRNIERLASRKGYSKSGLATYLGVKQQMVSRWIAGGALPIKYLEKIASYFEVKIKVLFDDEDTARESAREITSDEALRVLAKNMGYSLKKISGRGKKTT